MNENQKMFRALAVGILLPIALTGATYSAVRGVSFLRWHQREKSRILLQVLHREEQKALERMLCQNSLSPEDRAAILNFPSPFQKRTEDSRALARSDR
jgi:hypothetical protein